MDAFIAAVDDARRQLIRQEGRDVSVRELLRRAGYTESQRAGVMYHLNRKKTWRGGHSVPPELVERLTGPRKDGVEGRVLPISHEELARAAQVAAGYDVTTDRPDMHAVARFLADEDVSEQEKREVISMMARLIADEMTRQRMA